MDRPKSAKHNLDRNKKQSSYNGNSRNVNNNNGSSNNNGNGNYEGAQTISSSSKNGNLGVQQNVPNLSTPLGIHSNDNNDVMIYENNHHLNGTSGGAGISIASAQRRKDQRLQMSKSAAVTSGSIQKMRPQSARHNLEKYRQDVMLEQQRRTEKVQRLQQQQQSESPAPVVIQQVQTPRENENTPMNVDQNSNPNGHKFFQDNNTDDYDDDEDIDNLDGLLIREEDSSCSDQEDSNLHGKGRARGQYKNSNNSNSRLVNRKTDGGNNKLLNKRTGNRQQQQQQQQQQRNADSKQQQQYPTSYRQTGLNKNSFNKNTQMQSSNNPPQSSQVSFNSTGNYSYNNGNIPAESSSSLSYYGGNMNKINNRPSSGNGTQPKVVHLHQHPPNLRSSPTNDSILTGNNANNNTNGMVPTNISTTNTSSSSSSSSSSKLLLQQQQHQHKLHQIHLDNGDFNDGMTLRERELLNDWSTNQDEVDLDYYDNNNNNHPHHHNNNNRSNMGYTNDQEYDGGAYNRRRISQQQRYPTSQSRLQQQQQQQQVILVPNNGRTSRFSDMSGNGTSMSMANNGLIREKSNMNGGDPWTKRNPTLVAQNVLLKHKAEVEQLTGNRNLSNSQLNYHTHHPLLNTATAANNNGGGKYSMSKFKK